MKMLDLLDIMGGGSGTGRHRERGIDPGTGREDSLFVTEGHDGDGRYRPVALHKLIDGVFIPDGGAKPMTLDSAGHAFDGFPQTTGKSYGLIWARAADVDGPARGSQLWVYSLGRGEQFMPQHRGLLCMHANAGITFNLEAIRKMYPGQRPIRLRAIAGVAKANTNAITYTATFNDGLEGWDEVGGAVTWNSTGGQDGGGYAGGVRNNNLPYLTPPLNSILYGDLAGNFGSHILTFSYYLKNFAARPTPMTAASSTCLPIAAAADRGTRSGNGRPATPVCRTSGASTPGPWIRWPTLSGRLDPREWLGQLGR